MKTALITGIMGQDGSHLAELLLDKGYRVCGIVRRAARRVALRVAGFARIQHNDNLNSGESSYVNESGYLDRVELYESDLRNQKVIDRILQEVQPDEIYNLAAHTFVPASWQKPALTAECSAVGVTRILDGMRRLCPRARFFQASSSEMFGNVRDMPQDENTPFRPRTPYGTAKVYAHHITVNYRENYGLYAVSGILFNHEGPRRGLDFVTRKITRSVARIKHGLESELRLGNLQAQRDWGYAGDFVRAMWLMLQQDEPDDFVIGTGVTHSVQEFVHIAFDHVGLDWEPHVVVDPRFCRPTEAVQLVADSAKARRGLGWQPETSFADLVRMMVDADMERVQLSRLMPA